MRLQPRNRVRLQLLMFIASIALVCILLVTGAKRSYGEDGENGGFCPKVRSWGMGQIYCSKEGLTYQLNYFNYGTYLLVKGSGRYQELLNTLCQDAELIREDIGSSFRREYVCPREATV